MRIVIDFQALQTTSRLRGIGRYTLSFVETLVKNKEHEIILFLTNYNLEIVESVKTIFNDSIGESNIKICYLPQNVYKMNFSDNKRLKYAEIIREAFIYNLKPDFLIIGSLFEGVGEDFVCSINQYFNIPTAVIFYDLIPLLNPEIYLADTHVKNWYTNKLEQLNKSQLLFSISESSKKEAIEYLHCDEKNIINISSATNELFFQTIVDDYIEKEIREKFNITKPYLMYSGATDDRKNHLRLIEAYSVLSENIKKEHQLVFVGGMPNEHKLKFMQTAKKYGLTENQLIITGKVTDKEMNLLLNISKAFIFPSWHEGFGLPALEAMKCGKAVIASNTSSLPEVVGISDALFNPYDVKSISEKIKQVLTDDDFRNLLEQHSYTQSQKFSWDITTNIALSALEKFEKDNSFITQSKFDLDYLINVIINNTPKLDNFEIQDISRLLNKNFPQKKLLVDISGFIKHDNTNIQLIIKSYLKCLLKQNISDYIVLPVYLDESNKYRLAVKYCDDTSFEINDCISFQKDDIYFCLDLLSSDFLLKNLEIFESMKKKNVKIIFLVYDIIPILMPHHYTLEVSEEHIKWFHMIYELADLLITISKSVMFEVKEYVKKEKLDIKKQIEYDYFYLGSDIINNNAPSKILLEDANTVLNKLKTKITFLSVGTIELRKGYKQTLLAFEKLWLEDIDVNFVIVGKLGWMMDDFAIKVKNHPELNKRLFWLESINDEYLEKVYQSSNCLIAASEGEGFGLPLIEAAQKELPIIARDISVFKEVAGEFAYYFENSNDSQVIVDIIKIWLELYKNDKHVKSKNIPWLTWRESTEQLLNCIIKD